MVTVSSGEHLMLKSLKLATWKRARQPPLLKQRVEDASRELSPVSERRRSVRIRSPLEILQQRGIGSRPLAALTIQTVYATLSRYTTYIRGFKRDPLALARRVIANAWRSNWAMFGKLSWWVLGLFIGYRRPEASRTKWDWESYDGESIAHRCCIPRTDGSSSKGSTRSNAQAVPKSVGDVVEEQENGPRITAIPPVPAARDAEGGLGRSLYLWGKFSVAIMLAVGGAIVKGPAEMLRDTEGSRRSRSSSVADDADDVHVTQGHQTADKIGKPVIAGQRIPEPMWGSHEDDIFAGRRSQVSKH